MKRVVILTNRSFFDGYPYSDTAVSNIMNHETHLQGLCDSLKSDDIDCNLLITDFSKDESIEWVELKTKFDYLLKLKVTKKGHKIYENEASDLVRVSDLYRLFMIDKLLDEYDYVLYVDYDTYFRKYPSEELIRFIKNDDKRILMYKLYDIKIKNKVPFYYLNHNNGLFLTRTKLLPYLDKYLDYANRKGLSKSIRPFLGPKFTKFLLERTDLISYLSNIMVLSSDPVIFDKSSSLYKEFISKDTNECLSMSFMNKDNWSKIYE